MPSLDQSMGVTSPAIGPEVAITRPAKSVTVTCLCWPRDLTAARRSAVGEISQALAEESVRTTVRS